MFPGVMKAVVQGLSAKAAEINQASAAITRGGYDIAKEVQALQDKFAGAFTSAESDSQESPVNDVDK
jgi:hypothetical protein